MKLTRKGLLFLSFFLVVIYTQEFGEGLDKTNWLYRKKGFFWNVGELSSQEDYIVYDISGNNNVAFNVCRKVDQWGGDTFAVLNKDGEWHPLTGKFNNPKISIVGDDSLQLLYNSTDSVWVKDQSRKYGFQLKLICNSKEGKQEWMHRVDDPCTISIQWEHPAGCPFIRVNSLWAFFDRYRIYITPTIIIWGLFFLIVGGYFVKTSIFIISFSTVIFIVTALLYAFVISYNAEEWIGWIILPAAAIVGVITGYFTWSFLRIGIILIGLWAGATLGALLFQSVFYLATSEVWMLWSLMIVGGLLCAVATLKFYNLVMIIGTSIIGAFLLIRGIGVFAGGYPNEFQLHNEIISGNMKNMPWTVYVYVAAVFVTTALSVLWKIKRLKLYKGKKEAYDGYYDINP